tara:strand:- start:147 stop:653 length:507 start_codon:yes stop_codon:yes gene_type:complete
MKGTLVERFCPSLDKERAMRKTASAEKAQTKKAKASQRYLIEDYDIRKAIKPIARMMTTNMDNILPINMRRDKNLSNAAVQIWRRSGYWSSGHAWWIGGRMHLTLGESLADALFVIIHEFSHLAIGRDYTRRVKTHGREFRSVERSAVKLFNESNFRSRNDLPEVAIR